MISRLLDENRQLIGDPSNISGTIYVQLDVQPNEETVTDIVLTLDGEAVTPLCRDAAGDAGDIPGLAETGAQVEVECQLKTNAAATNECVGLQIDPKYANGEYKLSAYVMTTKGDQRDAFAGQAITLNNHGYVTIAHSPGAMSEVGSHTDGLTFYGGPSAEGNVNQFHACPVAYDGTIVGKMRLSSKHTDTSQQDVAGVPSLSFRESRFGADNPSKEAPFTWSAGTDWWSPNLGLENMPGETETWIINDGQILDPDGRDITATFRAGGAMAMLGPRYFDFKAPARTNESQVVIATSNDPTHASWGPTTPTYYRDGSGSGARRFRITEMSDMGVGHVYGMTSAIAVGDCGVGANADTRGTTAFVPLDEAAGNITLVSQLPEEDPVKDGVADGGGVDCYMAEVQSLADRLGNAVGLGDVPRIRTATTFGVDRTAPVISRERPSEALVLSSNTLYFEVEEPRLETGEDGSGSPVAGLAWAGSSNPNSGRVYWSTRFDVVNGAAVIDITPDAGSVFAREQSHTVYAGVTDVAGNGAATTFTFVRDQTDPGLSLSAVPSNFNTGTVTAKSVSVAVAGTLSDATEIRRAFLSIHHGATCAREDDPLEASQVSGPVRRLDNGTNTIEFSEVFTVKQGDDLGATHYCFFLHAEDDARDADDRAAENAYSEAVASFEVMWGGTRPPPTPTYAIVVPEGPLSGPEGTNGTDDGDGDGTADDPVNQIAVSLSSAPTANVTVTINEAGTVIVDTDLSSPNFYENTLTFTPDNFAADQYVYFSVEHDLNADTETYSLGLSAASGDANYDGKTSTVTVNANDDDIALEADIAEIDEDAGPTKVIIEAKAGSMLTVARVVQVSIMDGTASGADYQAESTIITIPANMLVGKSSVLLTPTDDGEIEPTREVLSVSADRLTIGEADPIEFSDLSPEGVYVKPWDIVIMDADPDVELSLSPATLDEDSGETTVTFTVELRRGATAPRILNFTVPAGSCDNASWAENTDDLVIDGGGSRGSVDVVVTADINFDGNDEECDVSVTTTETKTRNTGQYTVGMAKLTIVNKDKSDSGD